MIKKLPSSKLKIQNTTNQNQQKIKSFSQIRPYMGSSLFFCIFLYASISAGVGSMATSASPLFELYGRSLSSNELIISTRLCLSFSLFIILLTSSSLSSLLISSRLTFMFFFNFFDAGSSSELLSDESLLELSLFLFFFLLFFLLLFFLLFLCFFFSFLLIFSLCCSMSDFSSLETSTSLPSPPSKPTFCCHVNSLTSFSSSLSSSAFFNPTQ